MSNLATWVQSHKKQQLHGVTVALPSTTVSKLDKAAAALGLSRTACAEQILTHAIDDVAALLAVPAKPKQTPPTKADVTPDVWVQVKSGRCGDLVEHLEERRIPYRMDDDAPNRYCVPRKFLKYLVSVFNVEETAQSPVVKTPKNYSLIWVHATAEDKFLIYAGYHDLEIFLQHGLNDEWLYVVPTFAVPQLIQEFPEITRAGQNE